MMPMSFSISKVTLKHIFVLLAQNNAYNRSIRINNVLSNEIMVGQIDLFSCVCVNDGERHIERQYNLYHV